MHIALDAGGFGQFNPFAAVQIAEQLAGNDRFRNLDDALDRAARAQRG